MRAVGTSLLLSPKGSLLLWARTCATNFGHECMALHCLLVHDTHCLVPCCVCAPPPHMYPHGGRLPPAHVPCIPSLRIGFLAANICPPPPPPAPLGQTLCVSTHSEQIEVLLLLSGNQGVPGPICLHS